MSLRGGDGEVRDIYFTASDLRPMVTMTGESFTNIIRDMERGNKCENFLQDYMVALFLILITCSMDDGVQVISL